MPVLNRGSVVQAADLQFEGVKCNNSRLLHDGLLVMSAVLLLVPFPPRALLNCDPCAYSLGL